MTKNKNVLRWGIFAAVALILLYVLTLFGDDTRNYQQVDTSIALEQLHDCLLYTSPSPRD